MLSRFTNRSGQEILLDVSSIDFVVPHADIYQLQLKSGNTIRIDKETFTQLKEQSNDLASADLDYDDLKSDKSLNSDPEDW